MEWRFLEGWWERLKSSRQEAVHREQEMTLARERRDRDKGETRKQEERKADDRFAVARLSEESRRQFRQLLNDIDDAGNAARLAYQRALRDAETARAALDEARRNALVLPDGRRAYFTAEGRLMLEDAGEITDPAELEAARRARDLKPDATSYETYLKKHQAAADADARVERIGETLERLRELKERLASGNATPDELAAARRELDETTRLMNPEIREEYERLRTAGTAEPSADDPGPSAPTILYTDFTRPNKAFAAQENQPAINPGAPAKPAYKDAPEF